MNEVAPYLIEIRVGKFENLGLSLKLEDREKVLMKRTLKSQIMDFDGSPIEFDDLNSTFYTHMYLKFKQTLDVGDCENYPNEFFLSYKECDEEFVYRKMKTTYKIMPFWAAKTLDEVTKHMYVIFSFYIDMIIDIHISVNILGTTMAQTCIITFSWEIQNLIAEFLVKQQG